MCARSGGAAPVASFVASRPPPACALEDETSTDARFQNANHHDGDDVVNPRATRDASAFASTKEPLPTSIRPTPLVESVFASRRGNAEKSTASIATAVVSVIAARYAARYGRGAPRTSSGPSGSADGRREDCSSALRGGGRYHGPGNRARNDRRGDVATTSLKPSSDRASSPPACIARRRALARVAARIAAQPTAKSVGSATAGASIAASAGRTTQTKSRHTIGIARSGLPLASTATPPGVVRTPRMASIACRVATPSGTTFVIALTSAKDVPFRFFTNASLTVRRAARAIDASSSSPPPRPHPAAATRGRQSRTSAALARVLDGPAMDQPAALGRMCARLGRNAREMRLNLGADPAPCKPAGRSAEARVSP